MKWEDLGPKTKANALRAKENHVTIDGKIYNEFGQEVEFVETRIVQTEKQRRRYEDKTKMDIHSDENGKFVLALFAQTTTMEDRFPSLTKQDLARLMYVGTFVAWGTNRLQSGKHIIRKRDLQNKIGISPKRFREFYKRLMDEGIIKENNETGEIFVNPMVFYRGDIKAHDYDVSDYEHIRVFRKTVRELYETYNGRSVGKLAIIYSVLPFLNFSTNIISYNPDETDPSLIRPMSVKKLAALLGYKEERRLSSELNSVWLDGKPVFTYVINPHDRRERRVVVNPSVVYGGGGKDLDAIKAQFAQ
ncbi:replication/maintenance protein RepL [Thalassobacillus devorans]|uniref:replication/maintenance protein RepL n=1 Tax=Thalassobacillus devorans TaxID=279813 RepID=UPI000A1CE2DC|nr:replication/maintenance protein RepL [Thalassobacillus devorans]